MQVNTHIYAEVTGRPRFADALVEELARTGTRTVFGMAAESVNPLVDAVRRHPDTEFVPVRHEGAGALMASSYAKVSGRVGVCVGTAGPGATHLVLGAHDARADRAPLLALSGQAPAGLLGLRTFQEIDSPRLFAGTALRNHTITSPEQTALVRQVIRESSTLGGPSHLAVSSSALAAPLTGRPPAPVAPAAPGRTASKEAVAAAAGRLARSGFRILVGDADAPLPALWDLVRAADSPALVTAQAHRSAVPGDGGERLVRVLDGNGELAADALAAAPAVLLVGRLTGTARRLVGDHPCVVQAGPASESPTEKPAGWIRVLGDVREVLAALAEAVLADPPGPRDTRPDREPLERLARSATVPRPVWQELDASLPGDAVVTAESGPLLDEAFTALRPLDRLLTASFGLRVRGYAVPAAIGAALAAPDRPVVALTDARSVEDFAPELTTLAARGLPVTVVCLDAEGGVDITALADAVGLPTARAKGPQEAGRLVRSATESGAPSVLSLATGDGARTVSALRAGDAADDPPGAHTVAGRLARAIADTGVRRAYRSCAPETAAITAALRSTGTQVRTARHSESPAMMASADAKFSGALAAAVVGSGSDLLLQINGAYDAAYDHARLIVVSVDPGSGSVDDDGLFDGFARTVRVRDAACLPQAERAVARTAESGGVCLLRVAAAALGEEAGPSGQAPVPEPPGELLPPDDALAEAAAHLVAARRPAVLAGRGAQGSGPLVEAVAELLDAPIVTTMPGKDGVEGFHTHFVGGIGSSGHLSADSTLRGCDVLLCLGVSDRGSSAFDMPGNFAMVQIDRDLSALGTSGRTAAALHGDVRPTLEALRTLVSAAASAETDASSRRAFLQARRKEYTRRFPRTTSLPYPRTGVVEQSAVPLAVLEEFGEDSPYVVTVDVGLVTFWMYRYLRGRQRFVWTSSFATMGFALPAALAVAPLSRGEPVIAAVGDGGLGITMSELGTLAGVEENVIVLVFNNRRLGAVRFEQEIMGWPEDSCALHNGDISAAARAWGVRAHRATVPEDLAASLHTARTEGGPHLIEVVCEPDEVPALGQRGRTATQTFAFLVALARERRLRRDARRRAGARR